jgi:hypothetical protein
MKNEDIIPYVSRNIVPEHLQIKTVPEHLSIIKPVTVHPDLVRQTGNFMSVKDMYIPAKSRKLGELKND